jgi:hypothetical protein
MHLEIVELLDNTQKEDHYGFLVVLTHSISNADMQNLVLQLLLFLGKGLNLCL